MVKQIFLSQQMKKIVIISSKLEYTSCQRSSKGLRKYQKNLKTS